MSLRSQNPTNDQGNPSTSNRDLTSFVEDATERSYERLNVVSLPSSMDAQVIAGSDLTKFFERPVSIINQEWLQASAENDIIYSASIATLLKANSMWSQKFAGFRYCRGTAVVRIQVNPMPFHQGRLLLHFLPMVNNMPSHYQSTHNHCLGTKTAQPCVELDCRDGSAEMEISYIAPTQYYDLTDTTSYDWGIFYLTVLSPLASPDAQSVEYTVWLSFKDFELAGPIVPQAGTRSVKSKSRAIRIGISDAEKGKGTQAGIIESSAKVVSGLATSLSGIPMLSSVMTPLAWVSSAVSKVAGVFGWSKPLSEQTSTVVLTRYAHAMTQSIGNDTSEPLSYYSDPSLQISDGFAGSNVDEMSFAYLKTFDTYSRSLIWATSDAAGTNLLNLNLSLSTLGQLTTQALVGSVYTYISPPPMVTVARKFFYHRGGIRVTLKFVKTQYHSGRLAVTFMPGSTTTSATTTTASYILREVVDMRDSNEIVLELPYIINRPYLSFSETFGRLQVTVINELRAPPAVVPDLQILVYYGVGDDFEVAVPQPSQQRAIVPQGGDLLASSLVASKVIGGAAEGRPDFSRPALCVGETIVSLKQTLLRYQRIYRDAGSFSVGGLWPYAFGLLSAQNGLTPGAPQYGGDYINDVASGYALYRGGMRILMSGDKSDVLDNQFCTCLRAFPAGENTYDNSYVSTSLVSGATLNVNPLGGTQFQHSGQVECIADSPNLFLNVTVPYYNNFPCSLVSIRANPGILAVPDDPSQPLYGLSWATTGATPRNVRVYRACADDFQFGYFIGFPPQLLTIVP